MRDGGEDRVTQVEENDGKRQKERDEEARLAEKA